MDVSKIGHGCPGGVRPHAEVLAEASYARMALCSHPAHQTIAAHGHDQPYLSIHVLGAYRERSESGEVTLDAPGFALHWPGHDHEDQIGPRGLEALVIDFDTDWLMSAAGGALKPGRSHYWIGGPFGRRARQIVREWLRHPETRVLEGAVTLLKAAIAAGTAPPIPGWLIAAVIDFDAAAAPNASLAISDLARRRRMHPEYLAQCVRRHFGESLAERARRRRIEQALALVRDTDESLADTALTAGYCDQSHMNREFRAVLGRTPAQVRRRRKKSNRALSDSRQQDR